MERMFPISIGDMFKAIFNIRLESAMRTDHVSKRLRPHDTRQERVPGTKRYRRTPTAHSRVRLARASGPESLSLLDSAVSARLAGDLIEAQRILLICCSTGSYCHKAEKELNRVNRMLISFNSPAVQVTNLRN